LHPTATLLGPIKINETISCLRFLEATNSLPSSFVRSQIFKVDLEPLSTFPFGSSTKAPQSKLSNSVSESYCILIYFKGFSKVLSQSLKIWSVPHETNLPFFKLMQLIIEYSGPSNFLTEAFFVVSQISRSGSIEIPMNCLN